MTAGDLEFSTLSAVIDRRYSSFMVQKKIFIGAFKGRFAAFLLMRSHSSFHVSVCVKPKDDCGAILLLITYRKFLTRSVPTRTA
jgi:hypothetical protein